MKIIRLAMVVLAVVLLAPPAFAQSGIKDDQVAANAAIKGSKVAYPTFATVTDGSAPSAATYIQTTKKALAVGDIIRKTGTAEYYVCTSTTGPAWKRVAIASAGLFDKGTSAAPGVSFLGDTDTGMSAETANTLILSAGGAGNTLTLASGSLTSSENVSVPVGTSALPGLYLGTDTNTGISAETADTLILSAGGAGNILTLSTALLSSTELLALPAGAVGAPSVYFGTATTGLYSAAATSVDVATSGVLRLTVADAAVTSTVPVVHPLGAVGTPSMTFVGDLNTGIYSPGADALSIATAGAAVLNATAATVTIPTGVVLAHVDAPAAATTVANKAYVDNALLFGTMLTPAAGVLVNLGAIAVTPLYTCPADRTCIIEKIVFRSASANVDQIADATYNIGWQAVASGVVASVALVNPTATTTSWHPVVVGVGTAAEQTVGAATEVLNFNVTAACTTNPTTIRVDVFGYSY